MIAIVQIQDQDCLAGVRERIGKTANFSAGKTLNTGGLWYLTVEVPDSINFREFTSCMKRLEGVMGVFGRPAHV